MSTGTHIFFYGYGDERYNDNMTKAFLCSKTLSKGETGKKKKGEYST